MRRVRFAAAGCIRAVMLGTLVVAMGPSAKAQICPAVNGLAAACHTLITVREFSVDVVLTGRPPYEVDGVGNLAVDTLVGVTNNSSEAVRTLRIKGLTAIFDFDGSGVVSFGVPGNPLDTTGYGGPNAFFTDISVDKKSGTVNFITPIAPNGGTSFFSLEGVLTSALSCRQLLNSAVIPAFTSTQAAAVFAPNGSVSLQDAAQACGFLNFNWQQWIANIPSPSPFFQIGNSEELTAPPALLDPPPGGYTYQRSGDDANPFYFSASELTQNETATTLSFSDAPADDCLPGGSGASCSGHNAPAGSFLGFRTHLAGVTSDGKPVSLGMYFSWMSNYNGTNGGASRTKSLTDVDPGSGTGTVTLTEQQTTTRYPGTTVTSVNGVPVIPPPTMSLITPRCGLPGTNVTINGTGLSETWLATFNGVPGAIALPLSTSLTSTVPPGATTGPLSVTTPGGTASREFSVVPGPVVTRFSPSSGTPGTLVTIIGSHFTDPLHPGDSLDPHVLFNGIPTTNVYAVSDTQLLASVPCGATTGPIVVETNCGAPAVSSASFSVTLPVMTIGPTGLTVGESNAVPAHVALHLTAASPCDLNVPLALTGTATPGVDYLFGPSTPLPHQTTVVRNLPPGSPSGPINIAPVPDAVDEFDETLTMTVLPGSGYTVGSPPSATVTILDDDPTPVLTLTGVSVLEGDVGSGPAALATVALSGPSEKPVSVGFTTATGDHTFVKPCVPVCKNGVCTTCSFPCLPGTIVTATANEGSTCGVSGTDFVHGSGTITFPPGTLTQSIPVTLCGDLACEPDDTFFVRLTTPVNATIANAGCGAIDTVVSTIRNNDICLPTGPLGSFDLAPADSVVEVQQPVQLAFQWTVPSPLNWHVLKTLRLRVGDGDDTAVIVGFDEASNTFGISNTDDRKLGKGYAPGSSHVLETSRAKVDLSGCSVVGSGASGPSVLLNIALAFKPGAAGHTYAIEVAASDDLGHESDFVSAGTLTVMGGR